MSVNEKMTAIADAIRGKTGGTEPLTLDQMATEIAGIQVGGGLSEADLIVGRLNNTWPNGDLVLHGQLTVPPTSAFRGAPITSLSCPDSTYIPGNYCFCDCNDLVSVSFPKAISGAGKTFIGVGALKEFHAPLLTGIRADQVIEGSVIEKLEFPNWKVDVYDRSFRNNSLLRYADFGSPPNLFIECFYNCVALSHLILRKSDAIVKLEKTTVFTNTPFLGYGGLCGYCYVPKALIPDYQVGTNWSALYAAETCFFRPLEDYTVDGTTTGGIDWAKIEAEEVSA